MSRISKSIETKSKLVGWGVMTNGHTGTRYLSELMKILQTETVVKDVQLCEYVESY